MDDTTITISPESQITIEAYMYDAQQKKRQGTLGVADGLVHAVVSKIFPGTEPGFTVKTQTALMGVRGTEFYVLVGENAESEGTAGVMEDKSTAVPQARKSTDVFVKSGQVAMTSSNPAIKESVVLGPLQSTRVILNRLPGPRIALAQADFQRLRSTMVSGVRAARVGRTRNPRELLQKLPMRPLRPGPPLQPGEARPRLERRAAPPGARPAGAPPRLPQSARPPAAQPLKPGEKPPAAAGKQPPPQDQKHLTRPGPLQKEPPRTGRCSQTPAVQRAGRQTAGRQAGDAQGAGCQAGETGAAGRNAAAAPVLRRGNLPNGSTYYPHNKGGKED